MHARRVRGLPLPQHEPDRRLVVGDGLRVRHRADGGESASGGGTGAGRDRLDVLAPRFAEVAMHVDEPRRHHPPATADDANVVALATPAGGPKRPDLPVGETEIAGRVDVRRWVDAPPPTKTHAGGVVWISGLRPHLPGFAGHPPVS